MALTYETSNWTGLDRDDMQTNDSIEWAKKSYSYEFLGETRTFELKSPKDDFTVSGTFDESACETFLDQQANGWLRYVDTVRWEKDPATGEAISL